MPPAPLTKEEREQRRKKQMQELIEGKSFERQPVFSGRPVGKVLGDVTGAADAIPSGMADYAIQQGLNLLNAIGIRTSLPRYERSTTPIGGNPLSPLGSVVTRAGEHVPTHPPIEGFSPLERLGAIGRVGANIVTGGLFDDLGHAVEQRKNLTGPPRTAQDAAVTHLGALWDVLTLDVLPGREARTVLRGDVFEGYDPQTGVELSRPATPKEQLVSGIVAPMKMLGFGALLGGIKKGAVISSKAYRDKYANTNKTMSIREAEAGTPISKALDKFDEEFGPTFKTNQKGTTQIDLEDTAAIYNDLAGHPIMEELYPQLRNQNITSDIIRKGLETGAISDPDNGMAWYLSAKYNLSPKDTVNKIAEMVRTDAAKAGAYLQLTSAFKAVQEAKLLHKAQAGDRTAIRALDAADMESMTDSVIQSRKAAATYGPVRRGLKQLEEISRTMMAGVPLLTANRNTKSQIIVQGVMEPTTRTVMKVMNGFIDDDNVAKGLHEQTGRNLADMVSAVPGVLDSFLLGAKRVAKDPASLIKTSDAWNNVLAQFPQSRARMLSQFTYDVTAGSMISFVDSLKPGNFKSKGAWVKSVMTSATRFAETTARMFAGETRMNQHLERMGLTMEDALKIIQESDEVPDFIRHAMVDTEKYALEITFAADPSGPIGRSILQAFKAVEPLGTMLGVPFPRFMINSWEMVNRHNPMNLISLFNKDFRKQLYKDADMGFSTFEARERVARSITGAMILSTALGVVNTSAHGPRYYQVKPMDPLGLYGPNDYEDLRGYSVVRESLAIAHAAKAIANNQKLLDVFTPGELFDVIFGVRRFGEVFAFEIPDIMRGLPDKIEDFTPDLISDEVEQALGRWLGRFTVPLNALRDIESVIRGENSSTNTMRDTRGQGLIAPLLQTLPSLGGAVEGAIGSALDVDSDPNQILPYRVSPWTGQPVTTMHPGLRQLPIPFVPYTANTVERLTNIQKYYMGLPSYNPLTLMPRNKNAHANNLINEIIGQTLTKKIKPEEFKNILGTADTTGIDDLIAKTTELPKPPPIPTSTQPKELGDLIVERIESSIPKADANVKRVVVDTILRAIKAEATEVAKEERPELFLDQELADTEEVPKVFKGFVGRALREEGRIPSVQRKRK